MSSNFYEVQVSRVVDRANAYIRSAITMPVIARTKADAWGKFCNHRKWPLFLQPGMPGWVCSITEVDTARWEYLCASFNERELDHG